MDITANSTRARNARLIGLALTTALAGVTLSGCSTATPMAANSASKAETALAKGKHNSAVDYAEAAVSADPRNASYRATLGAAYLDSGRFASAVQAFEDARSLGDDSSRTSLSLALALAADGRLRDAGTVLDQNHDQISPSDLGLAYSLSGQPDRGILVLTSALRGGENTAKVRQNLAYSYALAGHWREARLMAAEDVPADQLGERMTEWASLAHPLAYRQRIASLLSVPAEMEDPGQPTRLALSNFPDADQLAAEAADDGRVMVAIVTPRAKPAPAQPQEVELPPIGDPVTPIGSTVSHAEPKQAQPASFQAAFNDTRPAAPTAVAPVYTAPAAPVAAPARSAIPAPPAPPVAMDTQRFAQQSSFAPAHATAAPKRAEAAQAAVPAKRIQHTQTAQRASTHLVQLGSFASEASARRAWSIYVKRYPELRDHNMVITQAVVGGKNYWRVSAAGYDARGAQAMCGRVKSSGEGCFAYAEGRPLPGAVDTGRRLAIR